MTITPQSRARRRGVRRHRAHGGRLRDGGDLCGSEAVPAARASATSTRRPTSPGARCCSRRPARMLATRPLPSKTNYGVPLPGVARQATRSTPNTNVRAAFTRTLARPNYYDLVPYRRRTIRQHRRARQRRPAADASWNVDVLGERYFKSVGVLSARRVLQAAEDYIYIFTLDQPINDTMYHVTQPLNGDRRRVRGVELALQNQLRSCRGRSTASASTPTTRSPIRPRRSRITPATARCPGSRGTSATSRSRTRRAGFPAGVSVNFHGSYVDIVGASNALDRFYDTHRQLDFSCRRR